MNFKKQQLKGVEIHGDSQVGTRTVNILMGEHAGEYVRGDIMDANAVIQAFDELKNGVDEGHDTLKELNDEIKANATVINGVITKTNKMETTFTEEINKKANSTELATLQSKVVELEQRIATLESNQAA